MGNPARLLFPARRVSSSRASLKTSCEIGDSRGPFCVLQTAILSTRASTRAENVFFSLSFVLLFAIPFSHAIWAPSRSLLDVTTVLQWRQQQEQAIQRAVYHSQLHHRKTGQVYNISFTGMPSGSVIQAMRLRTGSLRKHAVIMGEFSIPSGSISVEPSPERLLLVYENFSCSPLFLNSTTYELISRVIGLFAYDASDNVTGSEAALRKLSIIVTGKPIFLKIRNSSSTAQGVAVLCAFFEETSEFMLINNQSGPADVCTVSRLGSGYFSLVAKTRTSRGRPRQPPASVPSLQARSSPITSSGAFGSQGACKSCKMWALKLVAASMGSALVLGAVGKAVLLRRRKANVEKLQREAEQGETLQISLIRDRRRAPVAGATRTLPNLEPCY